jgi:hypothetical protein
MPAPVKPCDGLFSEETIRLLLTNAGRAQWLLHGCERCGQQVGARLDKGRWSPDLHWPSIPRRPSSRPATNLPDAGDEEQEMQQPRDKRLGS